jgi:hypothetical protein
MLFHRNTDWRLRPEDHEPVRSILRAVLAPRIGPGYKNRHLDFAARPNSPSIPDQLPASPFIPIFPRSAKRGGGTRHDAPAPLGLKNIANLPALILPPVKVEQLEPDLHTQNMVVVDGWREYSIPHSCLIPSVEYILQRRINHLLHLHLLFRPLRLKKIKSTNSSCLPRTPLHPQLAPPKWVGYL